MIEHKDPFYQKIAAIIKDYDRQVVIVDPEAKQLGFSYTIGNHLKGSLPELLIIGNMDAIIAGTILNQLSNHMLKQCKPFADGERFNIGGEFDLQVWNTSAIAKLQYTIQATEFFQTDGYTVQQVIVPDPKGHYPTDKRCHKRYRVPVLRPTADLMAGMQSTKVH